MVEKKLPTKIRVFTTPGCPYCFTLKEFLKEHQIVFEEINLAENQEMIDYLIKKTGKAEAPIIEIDGQLIVGFDREKISKLLKI
ncbi:MAG: glutaredoxin family protein [Minisyncoccales bacterium]